MQATTRGGSANKSEQAIATQNQVHRILGDAFRQVMHDSWRLTVEEAKERAERLMAAA